MPSAASAHAERTHCALPLPPPPRAGAGRCAPGAGAATAARSGAPTAVLGRGLAKRASDGGGRRGERGVPARARCGCPRRRLRVRPHPKPSPGWREKRRSRRMYPNTPARHPITFHMWACDRSSGFMLGYESNGRMLPECAHSPPLAGRARVGAVQRPGAPQPGATARRWRGGGLGVGRWGGAGAGPGARRRTLARAATARALRASARQRRARLSGGQGVGVKR